MNVCAIDVYSAVCRCRCFATSCETIIRLGFLWRNGSHPLLYYYMRKWIEDELGDPEQVEFV